MQFQASDSTHRLIATALFRMAKNDHNIIVVKCKWGKICYSSMQVSQGLFMRLFKETEL